MSTGMTKDFSRPPNYRFKDLSGLKGTLPLLFCRWGTIPWVTPRMTAARRLPGARSLLDPINVPLPVLAFMV